MPLGGGGIKMPPLRTLPQRYARENNKVGIQNMKFLFSYFKILVGTTHADI